MDKRFNLLVEGALFTEQNTLNEVLDQITNRLGEITFNLEERCENLDIDWIISFIAPNGIIYVVVRVK